MGKIVKFCGSCNEGFAEKFGFCPTCGAPLEAFELNPVAANEPTDETVPEQNRLESSSAEVPVAAAESRFADSAETTEFDLESVHAAVTGPLDGSVVDAADAEDAKLAMSVAELAEIEEKTERDRRIAEAVTEEVPIYIPTRPMYADEARPAGSETTGSTSDDGYHITVIEEKNTKQRNGLLLGSLSLILILALGGTVYSLFNKSLSIGAIEDSQLFNAVMVEDLPMTLEEQHVEQAKKEAGGGGGGGGREEEQETSLGDLANQTRNPIRPPDARVHRMDNPSLALPPPSTEGDRKFEQTHNRWGDPNSKFEGLSNGTGSGGGQGSGVGTGQGSGYGTGTGSGTGSGSGSGTGTGNGPGEGGGGNAPPPKKAGVTTAFRIISKPRALYTDAAREKQVQGKVTLRVTFLASGQIGSITTVKGLPYGLTEQAIAAARKIKFEPKRVDGVGAAQTRAVEYSFTIY